MKAFWIWPGSIIQSDLTAAQANENIYKLLTSDINILQVREPLLLKSTKSVLVWKKTMFYLCLKSA